MMSEVIEWTMFRHNGHSYALHVVTDYDASTKDADCYSATDIELHKDGSWQFVTLIVTDGDNEREALGGCHYGIGDGWSADIKTFLTEENYVPAMVTELEARHVKSAQ